MKMSWKTRILSTIAACTVLSAVAVPSALAASGGLAINATNFPDTGIRNLVLSQFDSNGDAYLTAKEVKNVTSITTTCASKYTCKPQSTAGLQHFTNLQTLELDGEQLTSVNLASNTRLTSLTIKHAPKLASIDLSRNTNLETLALGSSAIRYSGGKYTTYDWDLRNGLDLSHNTKLKTLKATHLNLSAIDLTHNTQLTSIDVSNNKLKSLNLTKNTKLVTVDASNSLNYTLGSAQYGFNAFTSLNVSKNTQLQELDLKGTGIASLDVTPLTQLESLYLADSKLSSINLSKNTELSELQVTGAGLRTLDVSRNVQLRRLNVAKNALSSLDISKSPELVYLDASYNKLTTIDVSNNTKIGNLIVNNNELKALDISRLKVLYGLNVENNHLLSLNDVPADISYSAGGQTYAADVNWIDLKQLSPSINVKSIRNIKGGKLNGSILTLVNGSTVSYDYNLGSNRSMSVTVTFKPSIHFRDVDKGTPHADDIQWLADNGISTGWKLADGSYEFRGMNSVVRQDMAAFLRRLAVKNNIGDAATWTPSSADWKKFKDVDKNTPHAEDILWLAHAGISEGWKEADGKYTFRGMSPVVRQDMAAFLKRLAAKAGKANGVTPVSNFKDVDNSTPHADDIRWLAGAKITEGWKESDGKYTFRGMNSVVRQDMAAFLHRLDTLLNK